MQRRIPPAERKSPWRITRSPRTIARILALPLAGAFVAAIPPAPSTAASPGAAAPYRPAEPSGSGTHGPSVDSWVLSAERIDPEDSTHAFVGNGYLGQRVAPNGSGYAAAGTKTGWPLYTPRYDGSFAAGLYARTDQETAEGRQALAALPTWSTLNVRTGGEAAETFSSDTSPGRISDYNQSLHLRQGLVRTSLTWTAADGRATDLVYEVLADRNHEHVGAVRLRMTPHWSGEATVTDVLDGRGARRMAQTGGGPRSGDRTMDVTFRTDGTATDGAVASTLRPGPGVRTETEQPAGLARELTNSQGVTFPVRGGHTYEFTKYVGVDTALTSRTPRDSASAASQRAADRGWSALFAAHAAAWKKLWRSDIETPGQPELQEWVRSAQYGLLSSTRAGSPNSLPPTGLTSDNYAGLVFWDAETWMYPSLLASHPALAKSVLDYRFATRAGARANARKLGYPGLFYPWTSGSKGDLWSECHSWDPPHCVTQIHLQSDIALATWQYYLATKDTAWLRSRGWPVLKGIAEFWAGRSTKNADGSYSITNVAGPDEYSNGVDDGVFTNAGAATALRHATHAAEVLGEPAPAEWTTIADKLRIPYDKDRQIFLQYDGYDGSLIKQADTALLIYPLQWPMTQKQATSTLDYYAERTDPDGPAMTDSVHAIDAAATGEPGCSAHTYLMRSVKPFMRGPFSMFSEARGDKAGAVDPLSGSPAQDFLTGKGGFLQVFTNGLTGQRLEENRLRLNPMLPPQLKDGVTLRGLRWQGRTYDIAIGAHATTVRLTAGEPFDIETPQGKQVVSEDAPAVIKTRRPDLTPTDNLARCQSARADSEEPGMYAEAAVDGSTATAWVPDGGKGSHTVDLGAVTPIAEVTPEWTSTRPASHRLETSVDGKQWHTLDGNGTPPLGRYVRTVISSKDPQKPAGLAELTVRKADVASGR